MFDFIQRDAETKERIRQEKLTNKSTVKDTDQGTSTCDCHTKTAHHRAWCRQSKSYRVHRRMEVFRGAVRLMAAGYHDQDVMIGYKTYVQEAMKLMDEVERQELGS